ncbi:hypothetical protein ASF53_16860 [Methylobacterium sp. Leaf123]|uniref:AAA family ATPase n=1 Tax=Methylobacterium sp. Leaf123 TaxID=1736264 RepID=UPI0006F3F008|nr:AAA family ATPase [Methylobacterium sp. Leaf123]KQQ11832.1 hypothetical protein ASF53_16860 [Methylobacterium sp. Leaf123]
MMIVRVTALVSVRPAGVILAAIVVDGGPPPAGTELRVRVPRRLLREDPMVGETWTVDGPARATRWGRQVDATGAVRALPEGALIREYLADHVPGIGRERANRLWRAFGTDLPRALLEGDVATLAAALAPDRPLLGPRIAAAAVRAWKDAAEEAALVAWLQAQGVADIRATRRIAAILGGKAVETLERNPFILVPFLPWTSLDALGRRLLAQAGRRRPEDAPERLVGAVDATMKAVIASGATAIRDRNLRAAVASRLAVEVAHPRLAAALAAGLRNGAMVAAPGGRWRAPGCAVLEQAVLDRLGDILALRHVRGTSATPLDFRSALAAYPGARTLHPEQREAVLKVLSTPFACLRGGAGVGKTTVVRTLCDLWDRTGGDVILAAIAGKAALRLSKGAGRLARTLFRLTRELDERAEIDRRLLEVVEADEEVILLGRRSQLAEVTPHSLVIVDESSMVDLASMHGLLRRMPAGARLVLVGDERQLPPVGFGVIFHALVTDPGITASLTVVHRQTETSGIPRVASVLRERTVPPLTPYGGLAEGVSFLPAKDAAAIRERILRVYQDLAADDPLVVAPTKGGPSGIRELNEALHDLHVEADRLDEIAGPLGQRFSPGEPVVHARTDYNRGLFNGSLGRVVTVARDGLVAQFEGTAHHFGREELLDLELGYALTCHRAQGSQAARVIIALTPCRLLDPSWVYTALTRGEQQVVLVGDTETLGQALRQPWAVDRRATGFRWPGVGRTVRDARRVSSPPQVP